MCNLYSLTSTHEAMRQLFKAVDRLDRPIELPAIFPDAMAPVCRVDEHNIRELVPMRWGFPKIKSRYVTNTRNLSSPYWDRWFSDPFYRCLVPATSFSECHPSQRDARGRKLASWFALRGDEPRPLFALAGLWRPWDGERRKGENGCFDLYAIVTTEPNSVVEPIHPKAMPVILKPADYEVWLHAHVEEAAELQRPFPAEDMQLLFTGEKQDRVNVTAAVNPKSDRTT